MKWTVTAEHTSGGSVGHPCSTGIYSDPVDGFCEVVEAESESLAIVAGQDLLEQVVAAYPPCDCRRHLEPGWDSWWDSVIFHATPVGIDADESQSWVVTRAAVATARDQRRAKRARYEANRVARGLPARSPGHHSLRTE